MTTMPFAEAVDAGLAAAMERDTRVITFGEDVRLLRRTTLVRFGPDRVLDTPISEAGFVYMGLGAAMGGLRPVVEVMLVDFLTAAWCPLVNNIAKYEAFSGGTWQVPMVIRASVGGWYGDGGQHEQTLWGSIAAIPGLKVVVPSTPADAAGLMLAAVEDESPVVYLEPKLLGEIWLDVLAGSRRPAVGFDIPADGASGDVPQPIAPTPIGEAKLRRDGGDLALISAGVGVHRALEAAERLAGSGVQAAVLDLRSIAPLDTTAILELAARTGHVVVVDEDYVRGGLTGEIAALIAEQRIDARFERVAVEQTIPFARHLEEAVLPNTDRIVAAAERCLDLQRSSA
ncbi:MAG TPA: transketolase C-terminal domain-containing protein [Solirubrobacteraceae bacterium]